MEELVCHVSSKHYSRSDRLKAHLEQSHNIRVSKQVNRFLCPFKCDQPAFRTMTLLLGHCEQNESSLGQLILYNYSKMTIASHVVWRHAVINLGKKHLCFGSTDEFKHWKEQEEEDTYTTYVRKQQTYKPKTSDSMLNFNYSYSGNTLLLLLLRWRLSPKYISTQNWAKTAPEGLSEVEQSLYLKNVCHRIPWSTRWSDIHLSSHGAWARIKWATVFAVTKEHQTSCCSKD